MEDLGCEGQGWRFEGVVGGEGEEDFEFAALDDCICLSVYVADR